MPGTGAAQATFPSKLLEFAENGLLIVSTGTGDVSTVISNESGFLLPSQTADELVNVLTIVEADRDGAANRAASGTAALCSTYQEERVISGVLDFCARRIEGSS
jgi:hypothetical protein